MSNTEWVYDAKPTPQDGELPAGDMQHLQEALRSPSRHYTGLTDDTVCCPGCWSTITPDLLCDHDDPDLGPLCTNRCCGFWHDDYPTEAA